MHLHCPHCHNPIEVAEQTATEISCPACGSSFRLDADATATFAKAAGKVGRFELIRCVGQGSFGQVYQARDAQLDRTVAVKVPRRGNIGDAPADVDRFLREARSVAQLRHPSIVTVHEAGTHEGAPYLVSDFVDGVTLADLLTARRPVPREAAQLIADVADALHYAHSQGVVHRDVKPSNIMLEAVGSQSSVAGSSKLPEPPQRTTDYAQLTPRLTDFGLAKRDAGEITMTIDGQVLGTPAYMSPEQARGEGHRVDGRSDVYSLGVILCQLLTGELPFRGNSRMLLHQVLHDEPRPLRRSNDCIPRDLETVCLKAMAKEPGRRYATARDFADDLRRYLKGEPIQARPVGKLGRVWRWGRRNPVVAGLTAALAVVMVVGLASLTWLWLRAEGMRDRAESGETSAKTHQAKAEANLQLAIDAVEEYCTKVAKDPRLLEKDLLALRRQLLETAARFHEKFTQQQADNPTLRLRQGNAYHALAQLTRDMGEKRRALELERRAVAIFTELVAQAPTAAERREALARGYSSLGVQLEYLGEIEPAVEAMQNGIAIWESLIEERPVEQNYATGLGGSYCNLGFLQRSKFGNLAAARTWFERAIRTLEPACRGDHPPEHACRFLVISYMNLAHNYSVSGQSDLGLPHARLGLDLSQRLIDRYPGAPDHLDNHARFHQVLAGLYVGQRQPKEALAAYQHAADAHRRLADTQPGVSAYQDALAIGLANLAHQHAEMGESTAALSLWDEAGAIWEKLVVREQDRHQFRRSLGKHYLNQGQLLQRLKKTDQALAAFERGLEHQKVAFEHAPTAAADRSQLDDLYRTAAAMRRDLRQPAEAAALSRERRKLWPNDPKKLFEVARELALCAALVGANKAALSTAEKAEHQEYLDQAMDVLRQAVAQGFTDAKALQENEDLQPLRVRADFQMVCKELGEKAKRPSR